MGCVCQLVTLGRIIILNCFTLFLRAFKTVQYDEQPSTIKSKHLRRNSFCLSIRLSCLYYIAWKYGVRLIHAPRSILTWNNIQISVSFLFNLLGKYDSFENNAFLIALFYLFNGSKWHSCSSICFFSIFITWILIFMSDTELYIVNETITNHFYKYLKTKPKHLVNKNKSVKCKMIRFLSRPFVKCKQVQKKS